MTDVGIVLIAEDDPDLGNFLRTALQRRSDRPVRLAVNGRQALQILTDEAVDVLVTDIQMPGMSGMELVAEIRKTQPALPIVMMTAHASVDYAVGALRHQVDEFLTNPVTAAELVPKVRELAERGAAARQTARALADIDPTVTESAEVIRLERQMLLDLAAVMGEQTSLSQQLDRAAQVQQDLLPRSAPTLAGYDFAGTCIPSFAIGGDFYDWHETSDGVDFTVADVMVFHGHLDGPTGTVSYADAGHGLTLHVRVDGTYTRYAGDDLPLGVTRDGTWTEQHLTLSPGDTLVSFSDGLFDLLGGTTDAFTDVAALVTGSTNCRHLIQRVTALAAEEKALIDDVTLVAIRRTATSGGSR